MYMLQSVVLALVLGVSPLVLVPNASAHSGGLNSQGCHAGSRPYHCHRSPSEMVGNRLRCDLGSRSSECSGQRSVGRPSVSENVRAYQSQLVRHCASLPPSFADGRRGPATERALRRFQASYGLAPDGKYGPATASALAGPVTGACR